MGMRSSFRDLAAYQRATDLADELHKAAMTWPSTEFWTTGVQLLRAADSIGANIAEGVGRWHEADRRRFLIIARASLFETEHWLVTAERRGLLAPGMQNRLDGIARPLSGLIRRAPPQ
jgi:four helix bundle protein